MIVPAPAQLQHETDSNGSEYYSDSPKPFTALTVTASISGTLSAADSASGLTNTVTYTGTMTGTLSRVPFVPIAYYPDFTPPDEGDFFLATACCCWKCRWTILGPLTGLDVSGTIDWTSVWTGAGAPPDTDGSLDQSLAFIDGYISSGIPPGGEGYAAQLERCRASLCRAAGESGRFGQIIRVVFPSASILPATNRPVTVKRPAGYPE